MTSFSFFGLELFIIYSSVGHLGLVLASGATAALSFLGRQWPWERLAPGPKSTAQRFGVLGGVAMAATLLAGLRVSSTSFDPSGPSLFWEWLTAITAGVGMVASAYAATGALTGLALIRVPAPLAPALVPRDEVHAALLAFQSLKAATERLRLAEREATTRTQAVSDAVAAAEYGRAADAIRNRLQLAEELQSTAGAAVVRLACAEPVRRLLERRPDAALARLTDEKDTAPLRARVELTLTAVRAFLEELEGARAKLQLELTGAEGSIAKQLGLDAAERGKPFQAAVSQLELTYGRVGHRLEALRLHLGAEADAGAVAGAALALTGSPQPAQDVVAIALEVSSAEQSATRALAAMGAAPSRIAEVVVQASASLARDTGDDEALSEVLRSVRRELER